MLLIEIIIKNLVIISNLVTINSKCKVELNDTLADNNKVEDLIIPCDSGGNSRIFRCNARRCKFQSDFYLTGNILSSVTKRTYDCCTSGTTYIKGGLSAQMT